MSSHECCVSSSSRTGCVDIRRRFSRMKDSFESEVRLVADGIPWIHRRLFHGCVVNRDQLRRNTLLLSRFKGNRRCTGSIVASTRS